MTQKTDKITVHGMECTGCEKIISKNVSKIKGVKKITVDYVKGEAEVTYDDKKTTHKEITDAITAKGYTCPTPREPLIKGGKLMLKKGDIKNASITLGLLILAFGAYSLLSDIFETSMPAIGQDTSVALLFIIGLFTGFHCIAMCGGFVVSYSTKENKNAGILNFGSHLTYGLFKTLSYAFFGAVFGYVGSFFTFTPMIRGIAAVLAGIFLILFGLNMLDMMTWFRRFRLKTPSFISDGIAKNKNKSPAVIGLLNGLMIACGPLQAIYLLAAASGSPYLGALYLTAFGLGTLPVLLGFGVLTSILSARLTTKIVRYSGVLVLLLGLIMVNRGIALTGTGYDINTIVESATPLEVSAQTTTRISGGSGITLDADGAQVINMDVTRYGWEPDRFILQKGVPVKWVINGKEITSCNNAIQVPKFGLKFDIKKGIQTIEFTPTEAGTIPWSCWMGMIPGVFIVKDDTSAVNPVEAAKELAQAPVAAAGSCGGSGGGCGCGCGG